MAYLTPRSEVAGPARPLALTEPTGCAPRAVCSRSVPCVFAFLLAMHDWPLALVLCVLACAAPLLVRRVG